MADKNIGSDIMMASKVGNQGIFYEIPGKVISMGVVCDGCRQSPILGSKGYYHCLDCDDFDFCEKCIGSRKTKHDRTHSFALCPGEPVQSLKPEAVTSLGLDADGLAMKLSSLEESLLHVSPTVRQERKIDPDTIQNILDEIVSLVIPPQLRRLTTRPSEDEMSAYIQDMKFGALSNDTIFSAVENDDGGEEDDGMSNAELMLLIRQVLSRSNDPSHKDLSQQLSDKFDMDPSGVHEAEAVKYELEEGEDVDDDEGDAHGDMDETEYPTNTGEINNTTVTYTEEINEPVPKKENPPLLDDNTTERSRSLDMYLWEQSERVQEALGNPWLTGIIEVSSHVLMSTQRFMNDEQWLSLPPIAMMPCGRNKFEWCYGFFNLILAQWVCQIDTFQWPYPVCTVKPTGAGVSNKLTLRQVPLCDIRRPQHQNAPLEPIEQCRDPDLPIYLIPAKEMARSARMPVFQSCAIDVDDKTTPTLPHDAVVLFYSHHWMQEQNPDPEGEDWALIQTVVKSLVWYAVDVYATLDHAGFSTEFLNQMFTLVQQDNMILHLYPLAKDFMCQKSSITSNILGDALLLLQRLHAEMGNGKSVAENRTALTSAAYENVFVWIDFVCLPQKYGTSGVERERNDFEKDLMTRSLVSLPSIQEAMSTVTSNAHPDYFRRAWCFAEILLPRRSLIAYESDDEEGMEGTAHALTRAQGFRSAFVLLHYDIITPEEALIELGLRITNGREMAEHVCRLLWAAVVAKVFQKQTRESLWDHVKNIVNDGCGYHQEITTIPSPLVLSRTLPLARGTLTDILPVLEVLTAPTTLGIDDLFPKRRSPQEVHKECDVRIFLYLGKEFGFNKPIGKYDPIKLLIGIVRVLSTSIPELNDDSVIIEAGLTVDLLTTNTILVGFPCAELKKVGGLELSYF